MTVIFNKLQRPQIFPFYLAILNWEDRQPLSQKFYRFSALMFETTLSPATTPRSPTVDVWKGAALRNAPSLFT